jgi:hypothetical protein
MLCKCSKNPIVNQNPVYSHTHTRDNILEQTRWTWTHLHLAMRERNVFDIHPKFYISEWQWGGFNFSLWWLVTVRSSGLWHCVVLSEVRCVTTQGTVLLILKGFPASNMNGDDDNNKTTAVVVMTTTTMWRRIIAIASVEYHDDGESIMSCRCCSEMCHYLAPVRVMPLL